MSNGNTTFRYDDLGNRVPSISKPVPEAVRLSEFGCRNCLYQSCECKSGSRYSPAETAGIYPRHPSCAAYAYYD
jgi:hypothetical protein